MLINSLLFIYDTCLCDRALKQTAAFIKRSQQGLQHTGHQAMISGVDL